MTDERYGGAKYDYKEGYYTLIYRNGFNPVQTRYYWTKDELNLHVEDLQKQGYRYYPYDKNAFKSFYVLDKSGMILTPKEE